MNQSTIKKAWNLVRRGRLDDALQLLAKNAGNTSNAECFYQKSLILLEAGLNNQAVESMQSWVTAHPDDALGLFFYGQALAHNRDWDNAIKALEQCVIRLPENQLAQNYLALALFESGDVPRATKIWKELPLFPNHLFLTAFARISEDRFKVQPDKYPELPRETIAAHQFLIYRLWHNYKKIPLIGVFLKHKLLTKWIGFADKLTYLGNYPGAVSIYDMVLSLKKRSEEALLGKAMALLGQKKFKEAKIILLKMIDSSGMSAVPFLLAALAYTYYQLGDIDKALMFLERCPTPGPEDYGKNYIMGLCYIDKGEEIKAHDCFKAAVRDFFVDTKDQWIDAAFYRILYSASAPKDHSTHINK